MGALNFSIFWGLLFVAAYRLPGGVAATLGAVQPLLVLALAAGVLGQPMQTKAVLAALGGLLGVALLALTAAARLDGLGVAAALLGAVSMAFGTVLTRKWQAPVSPLALTAWQLTAGGLLLLPVSLLTAPQLPALNWACRLFISRPIMCSTGQASLRGPRRRRPGPWAFMARPSWTANVRLPRPVASGRFCAPAGCSARMERTSSRRCGGWGRNGTG